MKSGFLLSALMSFSLSFFVATSALAQAVPTNISSGLLEKLNLSQADIQLGFQKLENTLKAASFFDDSIPKIPMVCAGGRAGIFIFGGSAMVCFTLTKHTQVLIPFSASLGWNKTTISSIQVADIGFGQRSILADLLDPASYNRPRTISKKSSFGYEIPILFGYYKGSEVVPSGQYLGGSGSLARGFYGFDLQAYKKTHVGNGLQDGNGWLVLTGYALGQFTGLGVENLYMVDLTEKIKKVENLFAPNH